MFKELIYFLKNNWLFTYYIFPILLVVIPFILTVIIPYLKSRKNLLEKCKNKSFKISKIDPTDFGVDIVKGKEKYIDWELTEKVFQSISTGNKFIILNGKARTGKTRTICNVLKSLNKKEVLKLFYNNRKYIKKLNKYFFIYPKRENLEKFIEIKIKPNLGARLKTQFSNNIRNNAGFLNRAAPTGRDLPDKLFVQQGRKVFKEVVPMVSEMILRHAADLGVDPHGLKRLWLHQANINMNEMIGRRVLGRDPKRDENVIILNEYANTSSAGSIIAFHKHSEDLAAGDLGLICSFGAGYSAGTVFVRKR